MIIMDSLRGKVTLITGSSAGIGAATAVEFAKYGAKVVITGRDKAGLNKTREDCINAGLTDDDILVIRADLSIEEDIKSIVDQTVDKFGQIDTLINNAGTVTNVKNIEEMTMDEFDMIFNVNARAAVYLCKLCIPFLKKTKGNIINNSSLAGTMPLLGLTAYSMSKAAMDMLTKCLMIDFGRYGIRVNSVVTGCIETKMANQLVPEDPTLFFKASASCTPMGRTGNTEDVAKVMTFLASDAASYVTGALLPVDGGQAKTMSICQMGLNKLQEEINNAKQE